jgi:hypothetical protein
MLPRHLAGTLAWTSARGRPGGPGGAAAGTPAKRRPWAPVDPRASQARPRRTIPSRQARCRQATTPPADHGARRLTAPNRGGPPHRATPGSSTARTARRQRRGHRRPVRPDTWMHRTPGCPGHWTPDAWTLDVRSTGWTDIPRRTGRGGQGDDRPGRRPDILATGGHPGRLRGDGTCATALTATAPGQLPSTARHQAAPRRTALLGTNFGLSVERTATLHPLWQAREQALVGSVGGSVGEAVGRWTDWVGPGVDKQPSWSTLGCRRAMARSPRPPGGRPYPNYQEPTN